MSMHPHSALPLALLYLLTASALADDVEPNDACPGQHVGMPVLPYALSGSLDTPPERPDVDFYRFDFSPGEELMAELRGAPTNAGTLSDPLLGLFDADCRFIAVDDDGGVAFESRLIFTVPEDGVVVLAATSYEDFGFEGIGNTAGTYALTIATAPPLIGSISGRVVDAGDGRPLSGRAPTFTAVFLDRCEAGQCENVAFENADAQGRFTFRGRIHGLRAGTYLLAAAASGYRDGQLQFGEPFDVAGGEHFELGDFPLEPNPLQISRILPCPPLPPEGGVCAYSLDLHNRSSEPFSGRVWSVVDYARSGADVGYAFQVGTGNANTPRPRYVWVEPEGVERVSFYLRVPPGWGALDDGGFACLTAGIGRAPFAVHHVEETVFIGCLAKAGETIEMLPPDEARSQLKPSGRVPGLPGSGAKSTMRSGR